MKQVAILLIVTCLPSLIFAQDWEDIPVPASAGEGMIWELQADVSDDFNYDFEANSSASTLGNKWTNFYHNAWTGPAPTVWKRDHVYVEDGKLKVKASRTPGVNVNVGSGKSAVSMPATNLGCITSTKRVKYPVYVETFVKITNSVLASDVWMLSPDDTQEIDICEAYGGDRWTNEWFSSKRLHLSHHVFIRSPFQDWQPSDVGSFYTDGNTKWRDDYHRIGVYWKDPWNLEYYVDGKLVRTRSGKSQIDPLDYTNGTGLSKEMDIIINTEDQSWRALQGLTPTDAELENEEDHTFKVDWIRIYKPVAGDVEPVTGVTLNKSEVSSYVGASFTLEESVIPNNAADLSVSWVSDKPEIASVNSAGLVECKAEGIAVITVTTTENNKTASCTVTVVKELVAASVSFDDRSKYIHTVYSVDGKIDISCNFKATTGTTVGNSGIKFWLREVKSDWSVVKDYVAYDTSAAGKSSGTAAASISLEGITPTKSLPSGNFYFLYLTFTEEDGSSVSGEGANPISIVNTTALSQQVLHNVKLIPNPAKLCVNIQSEEVFSEVLFYDMSGALELRCQINNPKVDIDVLQPGLYIVELRNAYERSIGKLMVCD